MRGNEHRPATTVTDAQVAELVAFFNSSYDEHPAGETDVALGIIVRTAYEQFPFQESDGEEMARTLALLDGALRAATTTVLTPAALEILLGGPLRDMLRAALVVYGVTRVSEGLWDGAWLATADAETITQQVARTHIERFVADVSADVETMRANYAVVPEPTAHLRRYAYNPLQRFPLVRLPDARLIAAQPRYLLRRVSPGGLYYAGIEKLGTAFATDLGPVVEAYVGQTLDLIDGATVIPEVRYGPSQDRSVDWFLVFDDLVVLIEAKSTRAVLGVRVGDQTLVSSMKRRLNEAIGQINKTAELLRSGRPEFSHIPGDRQLLGLVVTAEPFYAGNSSHLRSHLDPMSVPTVFGSLRELEHLGSHDAPAVGPALRRIITDPELSAWHLSASLARELPMSKRNAILQCALDELTAGLSLPLDSDVRER